MKKLPTRGVLRWLAPAALGLVLTVAALSLPWHGDRPEEPPRTLSTAQGVGPLRAGAAVVSVRLPAGVPIGGFARRSFESTGVRDPITARALVLEVPGARLAVVSAELLLVPAPLVRRVEVLLADLRLDALLVGATHTHAGPGGYFDDVPFERAALGPFDPAVFDAIASAIADAVRRAAAATVPAGVAIARGSAPDLVWSRSGGAPDGRLVSIRVSAHGGAPVAELLLFAAHATTLGMENRRISGDWPGSLLASEGRGVRLFLQTSIGDQSARVPPGDEATRPERYAALLRAADDALTAPAPTSALRLAAATVRVTLPPPSIRVVPRWLRPAASTLAWNHLPPTADVTALRVGPVLLVAVPAEPTAALAARWRADAGDGAEIVSLAGGYVGYVDDAERTRRGEGEAMRTYYGPDLAARLEAGVRAAAHAADR